MANKPVRGPAAGRPHRGVKPRRRTSGIPADGESPDRSRPRPAPRMSPTARTELTDAYAALALRYSAQPVWDRVLKRARHNGCDTLAEVARAVLDTGRGIHRLTAVAASVPFSGPETELASQLAQRIPLPGDESTVAAARGLQLAGIVACLGNGLGLSRCACYVDVVNHELKPFAGRLLSLGLEDWSGLAELTSDT